MLSAMLAKGGGEIPQPQNKFDRRENGDPRLRGWKNWGYNCAGEAEEQKKATAGRRDERRGGVGRGKVRESTR